MKPMAQRRGPRVVAIVFAAAVVLGAAALLVFRGDGSDKPELVSGSLSAEGTEFVLTSPSGRETRSAELVGKTVMMDIGTRDALVTIRKVENDRTARNGRVVLHHLEFPPNDGGKAEDVCDPDTDGRSFAFPVPNADGGYDLTCTSGALGKCVRWGYRPWEEKVGGPPLRNLHAACVIMTRADYGGDGTTTTRDGTQIYFCDRFGVLPCGEAGPGTFEAGWGPDRATCVARPRIAENISLQQIGEKYPDLAPRLGPENCTQDGALADSAVVLINRS